MTKLRKLVLVCGGFIHFWRLELWMAIVFSIVFFVATAMGHASTGIGWLAFALYAILVGVHQWTRLQKEKEIARLNKEVRDNMHRLDRILHRAHDLHRKLMHQREDLAVAANQLEESKRMLLAMGDLKNKFVATVSHELRTPLTAIHECVNLFLDGIVGPLTPKQKYFLDIAQRNVQRLTHLLDNVLDISQLELSGMKSVLARVSLDEMVLEAINSIKPRAQKKGVEVIMGDMGSLPPALVDHQHVMQVLFNLLHNAINYTQGGGRVGVSARLLENSTQMEVCVWDTGCGISPKKVEQMLGGFYQLSGKDDFTTPGAGLGLMLCKEIITQLGGSIRVESKIGKGSRFYFTLLCYSDKAMLRTYFRGVTREAMLRNSPMFHLAIHVRDFESLYKRYGTAILEDLLKETQRVIRSNVRMEDRVSIDYDRGRIHVLTIPGTIDMRDRIRKLNDDLLGKIFFAGQAAMHLEFVYGLAKFPHDGEDLESLISKIDRQVRSGGLDVTTIALDGAA